MFSQKSDNLIDHRVRHVAFLLQYFHGIEHVSGKFDVIPDALLQLEFRIGDSRRQAPRPRTMDNEPSE